MDKKFEVLKNDGTKEQMEIIATYVRNNKNYIIYKNLDKTNPHFYGASYEENDLEYANLNTNLTSDEKEFMNGVFSKLKEVSDSE